MRKRSILVVDDDPEIVELYTDLLTSEGYAVFVANAGWEALVTLQSVHPSLVILDLCIPGMDGFQVCREITSYGLTNGIPILIVSALCDEHSKASAKAAGGDHYMEKPFVPSELLKTIDTMIQASRVF